MIVLKFINNQKCSNKTFLCINIFLNTFLNNLVWMILPTIWMVCLMATTAVGSGEKLSMSLQQSGFHRFYNLLIYASVPENKCYILEIYDTLHISCSPGNQTHATIASHRLFQLVPTSIPISWTIWSDSKRFFCSNWFVYKINHFQYIFFLITRSTI